MLQILIPVRMDPSLRVLRVTRAGGGGDGGRGRQACWRQRRAPWETHRVGAPVVLRVEDR